MQLESKKKTKTLSLQCQKEILKKEKAFHHPDPQKEIKEVNPTFRPCYYIFQVPPLAGRGVAVNPPGNIRATHPCIATFKSRRSIGSICSS